MATNTLINEYIPEEPPQNTGLLDQYMMGGAVRPQDYRPAESTASEVAGMAAMVAPFAGLDPMESFQRIKSELSESGHSTLLSELENLAVADKNEATRELFTNVLVAAGKRQDVNPQELKNIVGAYKSVLDSNSELIGRYDALYEMVASNLKASPVQSHDADEHKIELSPVNVQSRLEARATIGTTIEEVITRVVGPDATAAKGVYELVESGLPFREQIFNADVRRGMVDRGFMQPLKGAGKGKVGFAGETFNDIRKEFDSLRRSNPERAKEFFSALGDVIQNETEFGHLIDNNGMMGMFYLLSVAQGEPEDSLSVRDVPKMALTLVTAGPIAASVQVLSKMDLDRYLSNAASVLDLFAAGILARQIRNTIKFGTGLGDLPPGSLADAMATHRPTDAPPALASMVKSSDEATAHGTTPEEAADYMRPKHPGIVPRTGPSKAWEYLEETIVGESGRKGFIYTDQEKANGLERIRTLLTNVGKYAVREEKTSIGIADDGQSIFIDATIGSTDNVGFPSFARAKAAAEEVTDVPVEFFYTNELGSLRAVPDKGTITFPDADDSSVESVLSAPGEWFFRVRMHKPFIPEDAAMFGPGSNFTSDGFVGLGIRKAGSPSSKFGRQEVMAGHRVHDMGARLQTTLLNLVKRPWETLPNTSKARVQEIVETGSKEKQTFTEARLAERYPSITRAEIDAYYSLRKFYDTVFLARNRDLYNRLDGRGVKHIINEATGFESAGARTTVSKMMEEAGNGPLELFDTDTNAFVSISRAQAERLQNSGVEFFRVEERIRDNKHSTDFLMVSKEKTKVRPLPRGVMVYEPGYYPRIYENKFFVREVTKDNIINGRRGLTDSRAIMTASTAEHARRMANELTARSADPNITYVPVAAKELSEGDVVRGDIEALNIQGRLFYSRRGEHLPDTEGEISKIADPIETIQRLHHAIARHLSADEWLDTMRNRFFKTYRKLVDLDDEQLKTASDQEIFDAIKKPADLRESGVEPAKAMWNYIRLMTGIPPKDGQVMRGLMVGMADVLSRMAPELTKPLTKAMIDNRNFAPLTLARTTAFQMYISLNPFRQAPLQAQQQLYLFGAVPDWFATGMAARQQTAMLGAYVEAMSSETFAKTKGGDMFAHISDKRMKQYASVAGMSVKEFGQAVRRFRNSGLVDAIDEHMFIAGGSMHPKIRPANVSAGRQVVDAISVPVRALRKVGFDSGEFVNMLASYLAAVHRFKKNNPSVAEQWYTDKYIDAIYGDARDLGLSMTKSGSYEWQHGYFANMLQFFSIQQKAIEGFLSNKAFTRTERLGLVAGQLALFGLSGVGLAAPVWYMWDKVQAELYPDEEPITIPDGVEEFIQGGAVDLLVNKSMELATGGDQDVRISEQIAAGSGLISTVEEKAAALMLSSKDSVSENLMKFFAGPSGTAIERISGVSGRAAQAAKIAWHFRNHPEIRNENALRALYTMAEVASGYNNYIKGRMWANMQKNEVLMQYFPRDITEQEIFIRQWFGFPEAGEEDYWKTRIRLLEAESISSNEDKNLQAADDIYNKFKDSFLRYGIENNGKSVNVQMAEELAQINSWVMVAFADDPIAKNVVLTRIASNMLNDLGTDRTSLATLISNSINEGKITTDELADWKQRVWNNNAFTDRDKKIIVEMLDRLMDNSMLQKPEEEE